MFFEQKSYQTSVNFGGPGCPSGISIRRKMTSWKISNNALENGSILIFAQKVRQNNITRVSMEVSN